MKNYVVKKDGHNAQIKNIEEKIPNIRINEFKGKIPNITNLAAATTALTTVENKIPNVSDLVKKI